MKVQLLTISVLTFLLSLQSSDVAAQASASYFDPANSSGVLDDVIARFKERASGWAQVVLDAALWIFWTLGTISLSWTMIMMVLKQADLQEIFTELVRFIMFFGFFLWLLLNGPTFAGDIIESMALLGNDAAGVNSMSPSGTVNVGFIIIGRAFENVSVWSPTDSIIGVGMSLGILLVLAIIAVNMLILLVSGWVLIYAGIFFLGFGGSRWTSDFAVNYFKTVLSLGVEIFVMILIIGIGNSMLTEYYHQMSLGPLNVHELAIMLVFCVALLLVTSTVPKYVASIAGAGTVGAGATTFGAGTLLGATMGAAATGAAVSSVAASAFSTGGANIAGGAQAVSAALKAAQSNVQTGSDAISKVTGTGTGSGAASGGMAGHAGKVMVDAATNLAQGGYAAGKEKVSQFMSKANERIDQTPGAKVAKNIQNKNNQDTAPGNTDNE